MNVLQSNVRLAEDRAAGVTLDLRQYALQQGLASHFIYGYDKGGKKSASRQNYPQVIKHVSQIAAMANVALFRLFNRDLFDNFNELYHTITHTPGSVILHFHVLRSYWLNLKSVVRFCEKVRNHKPDVTLVWALRDHWSVTERCAFTDGYEGWKTDYQKYPTLNNCPPVKIDRAHQLVADKRQLFHKMLVLGCQFISLSQYVADTFDSLYGPGRCRIINNSTDVATEAILADLPLVRETQGKPKIMVVVHDLRYDGKANQQLVCKMMALSDKIGLRAFDKFSSFTASNVVNHGFGTDKRKLMSALNQMDMLVFSSRADNYPLILCEALSIGVPVIAAHGNATREVLQKSGGKTVSEEGVLQLAQLNKPEIAQAIFGIALAEFSQRSRTTHSEQQMLEEHVDFYQSL